MNTIKFLATRTEYRNNDAIDRKNMDHYTRVTTDNGSSPAHINPIPCTLESVYTQPNSPSY